jgi:peptidoglycan/xylan/chitin deacetylase (PgdA/CDA1 family)
MNRAGIADDFVGAEPPRMLRRGLMVAQRVLHLTKVDGFCAALDRQRGLVVLMYHSVPDPFSAQFIDPINRTSPDVFERHMRFLARHRRVLPMETVVKVLAGEVEPEAGSVAITFDDGYRDNLTFVAPLLESLRLPATLYLPTSVISEGHATWPDRLYTAFRYRTRSALAVPSIRPDAYALDVVTERRSAYSALTNAMIAADLESRRALLAQVVEALAPSQAPPRLLLTWDEVRTLKERHPWFALGVHGAHHLDMTQQSEVTVRGELDRCGAEFRAEVGEPARYFAYPYNRSSAASRQALTPHGFRTAMGSGTDYFVTRRTDPLELPRIEPPADLELLGHFTSGAYPQLSRRLFGRW